LIRAGSRSIHGGTADRGGKMQPSRSPVSLLLLGPPKEGRSSLVGGRRRQQGSGRGRRILQNAREGGFRRSKRRRVKRCVDAGGRCYCCGKRGPGKAEAAGLPWPSGHGRLAQPFRGLPAPWDDHKELLRPVAWGSHDHEKPGPVLLQTRLHLHSIGPEGESFPVSAWSSGPGLKLQIPLMPKPSDRGLEKPGSSPRSPQKASSKSPPTRPWN